MAEIEIWRDIHGYENCYQVSNKGNVRSLDRNVLDKNKRKMMYTGVSLKPQINEFGYLKVVLMKSGKAKNFKIHRIVADAFLPNPQNLPCVNHKDGNKKNNKVSNLEWCTFSYNTRHAYSTGLKTAYQRDGERNPKAKFTNEEVRFIRANHKLNGGLYGTMFFARRYKVCKDTITNLINFKTYVKVGDF